MSRRLVLREINSMFVVTDAEDHGKGRMSWAQGMIYGRLDGLTDEQYHIVRELMEGYGDVLEGKYDEQEHD